MHNKYPRFVDKKNIEKIEDTNNDRLFKLSIPLNFDGGKTVLIIARAAKIYEYDGSSTMVSRILNYIKSRREIEFSNVSKVEVVFLFPVKEYDEYTLPSILSSNGEIYLFGNDGFYDDAGALIKNDEIIFASMMEADYVILGWGNMIGELSSIGKERIRYLLKGYKLIKNNSNDIKETYTVGNLNANGCPRHCLRWKETDELIKFEI